MRNSNSYRALPYNPKLSKLAKELRKAGVLCEVLLWNRLKNKQFREYDFDRQKIIGNYIVDFFCPNCDVIIEIDGKSHDGKAEYDKKRDEFFENWKLTVIHIDAGEVLNRFENVMVMLENHPALQTSLS